MLLGVHDHAVAYNQDLLAEAGVPAPPTSRRDSSWTMEGKFLDAAEALTTGTSQFGGHFFRMGLKRLAALRGLPARRADRRPGGRRHRLAPSGSSPFRS